MKNILKKTLAGLLIAGAGLMPAKVDSAELPNVNWTRATIDQSLESDPASLRFDSIRNGLLWFNQNWTTPNNGFEPRGMLFDIRPGIYEQGRSYLRVKSNVGIPIQLVGESNTDSVINTKLLIGPNNFVSLENLYLLGRHYDANYPELGGSSVNFDVDSSGYIENCNSRIAQIDTSQDISVNNSTFLIPTVPDLPEYTYLHDALELGVHVTSYYDSSAGIRCAFYRNLFAGNGVGTAIKLGKAVDAGSVSSVTGYNVFDVENAIWVMDTASPGIVDASTNCWIDRSLSAKSSLNEFSSPEKTSGRIVTDPTEIMEKFVRNNNPNVYVDIGTPLNYNPLEEEPPIELPLGGLATTASALALATLGAYAMRRRKTG